MSMSIRFRNALLCATLAVLNAPAVPAQQPATSLPYTTRYSLPNGLVNGLNNGLANGLHNGVINGMTVGIGDGKAWAFTYNPTPAITQIQPADGPMSGPQSIAVAPDGFIMVSGGPSRNRAFFFDLKTGQASPTFTLPAPALNIVAPRDSFGSAIHSFALTLQMTQKVVAIVSADALMMPHITVLPSPDPTSDILARGFWPKGGAQPFDQVVVTDRSPDDSEMIRACAIYDVTDRWVCPFKTRHDTDSTNVRGGYGDAKGNSIWYGETAMDNGTGGLLPYQPVIFRFDYATGNLTTQYLSLPAGTDTARCMGVDDAGNAIVTADTMTGGTRNTALWFWSASAQAYRAISFSKRPVQLLLGDDPDTGQPRVFYNNTGVLVLQQGDGAGSPTNPIYCTPQFVTVTLQADTNIPDVYALDFRDSVSGASVYQTSVTGGGDGTLQANDVPAGTYTVHVKGGKSLAFNVSVDATIGHVFDVPLTILPGDINNDNQVDIADFGLLVAAYGSAAGDSSYSDAADLNNDGSIDIADFSLLVTGYGQQGDL